MAQIDLRFVTLSLELLILEEYLDILDNQLPDLMERERKKIWKDVDSKNKYDEDAALFRQHYLDEGISIRFLTAAALIGIWAEYEASVTKLADYLRAARGLKMHISHLRGTFLEAAKRYFDDVLRFPLHPSGTDWDRLKTIAAVRHVLAHANGRLADVDSGKRKVIEELVSKGDSLILREDYLIVSRRYAREALQFVTGLLNDLSTRVEHEIKTTH